MNLDVFSTLFSVIAPVFLIAAIGYGWGKSGKTFDTPMVTMLVINIGVPCLVIDVLLNADLTARAMSEMALAAFLALAATVVVSAIVLKAAGLPFQAYLPALTFGNTGNHGAARCACSHSATKAWRSPSDTSSSSSCFNLPWESAWPQGGSRPRNW